MRAYNMRSLRAAALIIALLATTTLTACVPHSGCSSGEDDPVATARSLVSSLKSATSPADICQWVADGWTVSESDLESLQAEFESVEIGQLRYELGDQMGIDVPVTAVSPDGDFTHKFSLTSDADYRWTVANIGTLHE